MARSHRHPSAQRRSPPGRRASCLHCWLPALLIALIGAGIALLPACARREDPPNLVYGDAYLDLRHLTTYHDQSWSSTATWEDATVEALLIDRLGTLNLITGELSVPSSIHLTLRVKNTVGDILAEHPLKIGHNPWRDVIPVEPLDLYLRIATWRLGHDFLIMRVARPHDHALDVNVLAKLMNRF
jgi:hypothetical protein